jgi:hypothetical protein
MALSDLTRDAVVAATKQYDELGRDAFLQQYGFGPSRDYFLLFNGRRYDSKAIAGAAHGFALPEAGPLRAPDFSGGEATVARVLETLGFVVERPRPKVTPLPDLVAGRVYTWKELEAMFQFSSGYLGAAGGMVSRPAMNALLLITHPGGAKSFDYEDRWEDDKHLVYTGRGKDR